MKFLRLSLALSLFSTVTCFGALNDGLIAHYPFDGDTADTSGNNLDGTIQGDVQPCPNRFGVADRAMTFSGSNSFVITPALSFGEEKAFTFSAWFCSDPGYALNDYRVFTYRSGANQISLGFLQQPYPNGRINEVMAYFYSTRHVSINNPSFPQHGQWYLYTVTYDGQAFRTYLNGISVGEVSVSNQLVNLDTPLVIGGSLENCFFKGALDDGRVYNRALTQNEIMELVMEKPVSWESDVMLKIGLSNSLDDEQNIRVFFSDEKMYIRVSDIDLISTKAVLSAGLTGLQYQSKGKKPKIQSKVIRLTRNPNGSYIGCVGLQSFVPGKSTLVISGVLDKRTMFSRTSAITILSAP